MWRSLRTVSTQLCSIRTSQEGNYTCVTTTCVVTCDPYMCHYCMLLHVITHVSLLHVLLHVITHVSLLHVVTCDHTCVTTTCVVTCDPYMCHYCMLLHVITHVSLLHVLLRDHTCVTTACYM